MLPDFLRYDRAQPATCPNGRILTDDVFSARMAFLTISRGGGPPDCGGPLHFCTDRQLSRTGSYSTLFVRSLPAETVEFPLWCTPEKRVPFIRCKSENCPFGVPAVANTDPAIG